MPSLFDKLTVGDVELENRFVMAPLTRMRSKQPGNTPWALNVEYYQQRASAGLIVTEATQVSQQGQGYPGTPGIHSDEQVKGWKEVTSAVHQAGGKIFLQLWHVGRISHRSHQPDGALPVAPSAIAPSGHALTADWKQVAFETPRALQTSEIREIVSMFAQGAKNAQAAGFDGVEIHGANGYLIDQFLQNGSNQRTDQYGGSIENRSRLLLEIADAVSSVWTASKVGVRLSPYSPFNDMRDSDPVALFSHVLRELSRRQVAYAHVVEPRASDAGASDGNQLGAPETAKIFRSSFDGVFISAGGHTLESAERALSQGDADAVAFGRLFIANPDLPSRARRHADLNKYDRSTFYGGGAKGYTDYPVLQ